MVTIKAPQTFPQGLKTVLYKPTGDVMETLSIDFTVNG